MIPRTILFYRLIFVAIFCQATVSYADNKANEIKISIVGDSLAHGYGLLPIDGFVPKLQRALEVNGQIVELENMSVSGDTTTGGLERFEWCLTPKTKGVVIMLGGNDMLRGLSPKRAYKNLKTMIEQANKKKIPVLLIGIEAVSNFGLNYKSEFDSIFIKLENEFQIVLYPNFFEALNLESPENFLKYFQPDYIHPNAKGVDKIVEDFLPTMLKLIQLIEG